MNYDPNNISISWGDIRCEGFTDGETISGEPKSWFEIVDLSELGKLHPDYSESLVRVDAFDAEKLLPFSFKLEKDSEWHKFLQNNPNENISIDF